MTNIFISYRRGDSADATGRINDRLRAAFGSEAIFTDVDSIPPGVDFRGYIDRKVSECGVLLAVVGRDWLDIRNAEGVTRLNDPADFVRIEIESALRRGIRVIPLLVRGATMPSASQLPASLSELSYRQAIQIRSDPDFNNDIRRLLSGLREIVESLQNADIQHPAKATSVGPDQAIPPRGESNDPKREERQGIWTQDEDRTLASQEKLSAKRPMVGHLCAFLRELGKSSLSWISGSDDPLPVKIFLLLLYAGLSVVGLMILSALYVTIKSIIM